VHNIFVQVALEPGDRLAPVFGFVGMAFHAVHQAARRLRDLPDWQEERQLMIAIQVAMISVLIFGLQVDVSIFRSKVGGFWQPLASS